jgi:hypothetical protein
VGFVATRTTTRDTRAPRLHGLAAATPAAAALALLLVAAAGFLFYETRGTMLWFDEWSWALDRRGWDVDTFLEPHNEHLSLLPIAIYKLLFATAGLDSYGPYRALLIVAHLGCVVLVFLYAGRRVGSVLALGFAALLLFLGPGWQNIVWPFQVAWLISLGAGVGALLLLDRGDRRGDVGASALLGISLASSGLGIAIAAGLVVEMAQGPRRRLLILAAPLFLYGLWWLFFQDAGLPRENIDQTPVFVAEAAAGALSALAGLTGPGVSEDVDPLEWGRPLAILAVVVLAWRLSRLKPVPPRVLGLLAILLTFWVLTGLRRANFVDPTESRYLYVGALFGILIAAELLRGVTLPRWVALLVACVIAAAVITGAGTLRDAARYLRGEAEIARANLGALELARDELGPDYVARWFPGYPFVQLRAGSYLEAAEQYGSPADTPEEIAAAPEPARLAADTELVSIHSVRLRASAAPPELGAAPEVISSTGGELSERASCVRFRPDPAGSDETPPALDVTVPAAGLLLRSERGGATVGVRRFAEGFSRPLTNTLAPSASAALRIASDSDARPWRARVIPQERVRVCGLR